MSFPYKLDVEPGLKRLSTRSGISPKYIPITAGKIRSITIPRESRTSRAIIVDQETVLRPLGSKDCKCSRNSNRQRSKETEAWTKCMEKGINTFITGPLQHNKHCLTNVRARNHCNCKSRNINKLINGNMRAKEIQAVIPRAYSLADKACSQCIEMSTCSTQFFDNLESQIDYTLVTSDKDTMFIPVTVEQQVSDQFHEQHTETENLIPASKPANIDTQVSDAGHQLSGSSQHELVSPEITKEKRIMIPASTSINIEQKFSKKDNEMLDRSTPLKTTDQETTITLADHDILNHCSSQMRHLRWVASNRWALSRRAVHGPDF